MFWPISTHTPPLWSNTGDEHYHWIGLREILAEPPLWFPTDFPLNQSNDIIIFGWSKHIFVSHALNGPILRLSVTSGTWSPPLETCHPEQCARTAPKQTWGRRPSGGISMPYFGGLHELQVKWIIMWLSSRIFIQKKLPLRLTCVGISLVSISHLGTNPVQHVWLALGRATRPKVIGGWVPLNEII